LDEHESYLFPLKYKPGSLPTDPSDLASSLGAFIDECQMSSLKPHLETELPKPPSKDEEDTDQIPIITLSSWPKLVKDSPSRYIAIEIYAQTCLGCKQLDPLLPSLQKRLLPQDISLCQVNLMTELPWLVDIEKTPSFLIYDKKRNMFKLIDTDTDEEEDAEKELIDIIEKRITREVI